MTRRSGATTSVSGLISVVSLYVVLIILVLVFSSRVLQDLTFSHPLSVVFIVLLAIVFPLFLLVTIILNVYRLARDRARHKPGATFKTKLLVFFVLLILLAAVPQGVLSVNFINTAMFTWFSTETGTSLRGAIGIAIEYISDKEENLISFTAWRQFPTLIDGALRQPNLIWLNTLKPVNPELDSFQVFTEDYQEVGFFGDPLLQLTPSEARAAEVGVVARGRIAAPDGRSVGALRIKVAERTTDGPVIAFLGIELPQGFTETAAGIQSSADTFGQLENLRSSFLLAIVLFYGLFSIPLFLLAILVSFLLSDEIIRPLAQLEEATHRVAEGDFSFRVLTRNRDDLSHLVGSFNQMVSELERSRTKLLQTEKVAAWQEIAQRLAHEIKNPLTPIRLSAERLLHKYKTNPKDLNRTLEPAVESIIREVEGLNRLLTEFRSFSRLPEPQVQVVSVRHLVDEVATTYGAHDHTHFDVDGIDKSLRARVDPSMIKQILANLFTNAVEAMGEGGTIVVRADLVRKGNRPFSRLQIIDNGPGIAPAFQNQVFNPYFTTREHGTGLGLAIVERIVADHRGQIWFETGAGTGTTFFVDLPAAEGDNEVS